MDLRVGSAFKEKLALIKRVVREDGVPRDLLSPSAGAPSDLANATARRILKLLRENEGAGTPSFRSRRGAGQPRDALVAHGVYASLSSRIRRLKTCSPRFPTSAA